MIGTIDMTKTWFLAAALTWPAMPAIAAGGWEDLALLDGRVEAAVGAPIGAPGGAVAPIDRRLRLAVCPETAQIDAPVGGAVAVRCPSLGWRVRVPLSAAFGATTMSAEPSVRRGDLVEIEYEGEGFSASASGVALDDAAVGKAIRVKTSTTQTITAVVSGNGRARISP